jgi:hypothetical protein
MSQTTSNEPVAAPVLTETPEELAYELRAAEGATWTGTRLAIGIGIFSFASLAFAYFYLRSQNNADLWRSVGRAHSAPTAYGAAVLSFMLAFVALTTLGVRRLKAGRMTEWLTAGWVAVLSGLIALGLQIFELTHLPFYPGATGYASCFIGWASMNIVAIFASVYWSETLLARFMRLRRAFSEEGGEAGSPLPAARLFRANAEGAAAFMLFIAVAEVFFWVLFYVI